jgi:UPF0716 protein FxsA
MVGLVVLVLALVAVIELTVVVLVAQAIGVLPTIALLLLVSLAGGWLVKRQGLGLWRRVQATVQSGGSPAAGAVDGAVLLGAGTLLVVPGFVTDLLALVLLVPPLRHLVGRRAVQRWRSQPGPGVRWRSRVVDVESVGDVTPHPTSPPRRRELDGPR